MEHEHGAAHRHESGRALRVVLVLSAAYMIAEAVGGWLTDSLALFADAGHMLSDVASLALTLFAGWIARRPAPPSKTYGYYRAEILAALLNGTTLLVIAILVSIEAVQRFRDPPQVAGGLMMAIASGGLIVNLIGLRLLHAEKEHSLNVHGAWLHVMADALGSVAAMAAGALIWWRGWNWADPVASLLISILVAWSSWSLVRRTVNVLMEGAPRRIDVDKVRNVMIGVPGVSAVHDLHVWSITSGLDALSAHVIPDENVVHAELLAALEVTLVTNFGIHHVTIQIESKPCEGLKHSL